MTEPKTLYFIRVRWKSGAEDSIPLKKESFEWLCSDDNMDHVKLKDNHNIRVHAPTTGSIDNSSKIILRWGEVAYARLVVCETGNPLEGKDEYDNPLT